MFRQFLLFFGPIGHVFVGLSRIGLVRRGVPSKLCVEVPGQCVGVKAAGGKVAGPKKSKNLRKTENLVFHKNMFFTILN